MYCLWSEWTSPSDVLLGHIVSPEYIPASGDNWRIHEAFPSVFFHNQPSSWIQLARPCLITKQVRISWRWHQVHVLRIAVNLKILNLSSSQELASPSVLILSPELMWSFLSCHTLTGLRPLGEEVDGLFEPAVWTVYHGSSWMGWCFRHFEM